MKKAMPAGRQGFTIIEVLVSVALFSLIISVIMGIFNFSLRSQKRGLAEQQIIDQTSYLMEYMSRAARMARKDPVGACLTSFGANYNYETSPQADRIRFLSYQGQCQEFLLEGNQIKERKSSDASAANFGQPLPLTSPQVIVNLFKVGSSNSWDQNDSEQPLVTIAIEAESQPAKFKAKLRTQISVSQRNLDIKQ